ncbi:ADP/ATP carrier protein [Pyricularia grisea]|uniref:Arginine N-methyltransferase 2 n=1 Tax=Pyricularia grisea TaxID=148305 RepID=A0A6P8B3Z3_PYRGI|nr:hypothetical protein PgNI_06259 [Pyricularia grisea]KAI6348458.1 ADP/ATP carrier protein [Pyricularia grisea]TLD10056.1 hypothetical protein PgNI_06259 [Pyricularia grisea]
MATAATPTAPAATPPPQAQPRISASCPEETAAILRAAATHDVPLLKKLLDEPGKASVQDPETRETPLHAAVRAAAGAAADDTATMDQARKTLTELFWSGAIWNDVDDRDETPGCVALREGLHDLYAMCRDAGVRAEMLFGLMDGYEALSSGGSEVEEVEEAEAVEVVDLDVEDGEEAPELVDVDASTAAAVADAPTEKHTVESEAYLASKLTYKDGALVDDAGNGVMMAWETDIMRRSVDALLPELPAGKRILNVGFGMGIIDSMFAATKPSRHHIIEAHPAVIQHAKTAPDSKFGAAWEESGPEPGAFKMHQGRWQDVCRELLEAGEVYDAIYFDTFGEDYSQLRLFFTEFIPGLLDAEGRFGFFNGLGADRRVCYDVYINVSEMHLAEAGLDVDWTDVPVDMERMAEAGKGEWEGVKRRYWTLDNYRLPVCTFLG